MAGKVAAYIVPRANVDQVWPGVANMIDEAYKFADEIMPHDMLDQLRSGHRQLWVVWNGEAVVAAVMTRIIQLRSCRAVQVTAAGGSELGAWKDLITLIEDYARAEGCRKVTIEGRPGWERTFKNYRRVRVVIEREV